MVLEVRRHHVAGAVLSPVSVQVCSVWMQAAVGVELLVGAAAALRVVMMVVVVMVVFVTVVLWMSVGQLDQPHVLVRLELGQFVRAHLLLRSPLVGLGDGRAAAAVLKAGLRLRPSLFGHVDESV